MRARTQHRSIPRGSPPPDLRVNRVADRPLTAGSAFCARNRPPALTGAYPRLLVVLSTVFPGVHTHTHTLGVHTGRPLQRDVVARPARTVNYRPGLYTGGPLAISRANLRNLLPVAANDT